MVSISGKTKFITFEIERAFPLHVGREDHVAVDDWLLCGRCAMQIDNLFATSSRASQSSRL